MAREGGLGRAYRVRRAPDDRGLNGAGQTATQSGAEPHGERPPAAANAVCLLHSRCSAHERAVAALAEREFPCIAVSLSAEIVPELRRYERATTTLANAFVQAPITHYMARIEACIAPPRLCWSVLTDAGGLASPEMGRRFAVRLLKIRTGGRPRWSSPFSKAWVTSCDMGEGTVGRRTVQARIQAPLRRGQPDAIARKFSVTGAAHRCLIERGATLIPHVSTAACS